MYKHRLPNSQVLIAQQQAVLECQLVAAVGGVDPSAAHMCSSTRVKCGSQASVWTDREVAAQIDGQQPTKQLPN